MDDVKQRIESIESVNRRIIATLVRLEGKVDDLAANVMTKDDASRIDRRFDAIAGQLDDLRFRYAVHADTLKRHDDRFKKLEKRSS